MQKRCNVDLKLSIRLRAIYFYLLPTVFNPFNDVIDKTISSAYFHLSLYEKAWVQTIENLLQVKAILQRHLTSFSVIILEIVIIHF